jgi:hypothetical protein
MDWYMEVFKNPKGKIVFDTSVDGKKTFILEAKTEVVVMDFLL